VRNVSLTMTEVNFGDDPDSTAWRAIGFDLDGRCTTASSTDVCSLVSEAPRGTQTDGMSGIDNSFGANICPIWDTTSGAGACSTQITQAYVVTDASGSGTLAIQVAGQWVEIPITDAYVTNSGGAGVLGAVMKPDDFLAALNNAAIASGVLAMEVCNGNAFDSVYFDAQRAVDILADGSNLPGPTCDAISIGMQFFDATTFTGALPDVPNGCADSGLDTGSPEGAGTCLPEATVCLDTSSPCCPGLTCAGGIPMCCYATGQSCAGTYSLCCDPGASCTTGTCCAPARNCQSDAECCGARCLAGQCSGPDGGTDSGTEAGPTDAGGE
jgi:hypothetical protein